MRTAPAPNLPPIPGMNPGQIVAAGGGGSGGGDGDGSDGKDKEGAGDGSGGDDATSDNRSAPDPAKYPTCGTESHPVDVVTGRVFTHPIVDLALPGPLPFTFERSYSSAASKEDQGLGYGWAHSLGWFVQVERRRVRVWNDRGVNVDFAVPQVGHTEIGAWGWLLRRELWGYAVAAADDVWRIFSVTNDEGKTFRLSAIDDRNKNRISITYDDGRLVEIKDSVGRVVKVTSTKEGRIASLQVKNAEHQGQWVSFARYQYDDGGRLVRATDADDYSWTYEYDKFDRMVRDTDRSGLSFCFRYDAKDRGIEAWGEYAGKRDPSLADDVPLFLADGRTRAKGIYHRKLDYHANGYTEVTDTTETRRYFGNAKGTVDKAVTGGAVTTSIYDERGFEIAKTDPMGATTTWVRDERGRVIEEVDPLGRRKTITRDAYGMTLQFTDAAGGVTTITRDQRGNFKTGRDAAGGVTEVVCDDRGLNTAVTDARGATFRYSYDDHGNVSEIVQPNGGTWAFNYDAFGRRLMCRDAAGAVTRYAYSNRGDLVAVYDAGGGATRFTFDGERHLTQIASPKGHVTHLVWGGFHQLAARRDPNGNVVRLEYSREGELLAIHNEREEVHRLRYDAAGRLIEEETFDGRRLRYRRDAAGRVVRIENGAGEIRTLSYDAAGQLVERTLPDDSADTFEYDSRGLLVGATNGAGQFRFERDAMGRIVREMQKVGGVEHWVSVAYDAVGDRVGRATSLGHSETVERDAMGSPVLTILDNEHRIEHGNDVFGRELSRRLPGGGAIESGFDTMGRLVERLARSPRGARSVGPNEPEWLGKRDDGITTMTSYEYDADSEIISRSDRLRGVTRFDYDPVGQLIAAVPERARAEMFRYDATGNAFESGDGAADREYGRGNRLIRKGTDEYEWDAEGRLARKRERTPSGDRIWKYSWSGAGFLERVDTPEGKRVQFAYDPFGRRVEKRVEEREGVGWRSTSRTRFVWDGDVLAHHVRETAAASGDPVVDTKTFVYDERSFAASAHRDESAERGRHWFHYVNDASGAPDTLVDERGEPACVLDRSAWGRIHELSGALTTTPLRLQGQYEDEETSLVYNRARYYEPATGRFISSDPIGCDGGLNLFAYAPNPIGWADPFGLSPDDTVLLGRVMATRVQPAAAVLDAHTYSPNPINPENRWENVKDLPPGDPRRAAQLKAAAKNQKQWMRDMIKSGRRICDIENQDEGKPPIPKGDPDFCGMEHDVLKKAGYTQSRIGSLSWTDSTGAAHTSPLYEWKK
jgi:RHS repeat-associated protein